MYNERNSSSGKTSFCLRLLQNFDSLCTEREIGGGIIWCYTEKTAAPKSLQMPSKTTYHEGVTDKFEGGGGKPCLVILDDLLNDVYSKQVCDLFTRGSRHRNICVILITQKLFHQGRYCRDISLNADYLVALKKSEVRNSSRTWPNRCIPKIVSGYMTPTWMRHNDRTIT